MHVDRVLFHQLQHRLLVQQTGQLSLPMTVNHFPEISSTWVEAPIETEWWRPVNEQSLHEKSHMALHLSDVEDPLVHQVVDVLQNTVVNWSLYVCCLCTHVRKVLITEQES